jgi:hypothetical protein
MKKLYFLALSLIMAFSVQAQVGVTGCNDPNGGIQIIFDEAAGCNAGTLTGMSALGFHSGMNGWMSVVDWDAGSALQATNDGNDDFVVSMPDVDAYYGQAAGTVTRLDFVFNQGPTDPGNPWSAEGKMDDGAGGCADFFLELANITATCGAVNTRNLLLDLGFEVLGNPFTDQVTVRFNNDEGSSYSASLTDAMGRTLRTYNNVTANQLVVERGNLATGFYYLTFTNEEGKFASVKLLAR